MKTINFNTDCAHDTQTLAELAAGYEQAASAAHLFESRILAVQVGAAGLMATLSSLAKGLGLVFTQPKTTAAKAIRSVGKAAKEAKKDLASFDEINRLSAPEENQTAYSSGGIAGAAGTGLDVQQYMDTIHRLTVYMSGALLALGAILAFSGANIPLGLGLMAVGALGLAAVAAENWDSMTPGLRDALTKVTGILGGAALGIGAVLAFSGANIPAGLGLMALGAAGLAAAAALNWDTVSEALRGPVGKVTAIAGGALLALGAVLAFSGANVPLGLGLMAAGGAALGAAAAANWDWLPDKLKDIWGKITQWWNSAVAPKLTMSYWQQKFSGMAEGLKAKVREGINAAIGLMNRFIGWLNRSLCFSWGGLTIQGQNIIPAGSIRLANIPAIPMLAKGAVIPPNAPFLAMLGDQSRGNNIEAPEELLRKIVREEAGNLNLDQNFSFDVNLDGLTLARRLYQYNRQVSAEHGTSLIGGV